jgi:hypothetical protein
VTMTVLLSQDYKQPNDDKGSRKKIKANEIRSGTLNGRYWLRGSLLAIQDTRDPVSGFIAFGNNIDTVPQDETPTPVNATGILQNYAGITVWRAGVLQVAIRGSDGITAGAGVVLLDADGLTLDDANVDSALIKWKSGTDVTGSMGTYSTAGVAKLTLQVNEDAAFDDARFHINVFDTSASDTLFRMIAIDGGTHHAEFGGAAFAGVTVGAVANPEAMLDIRGGMCLTDGITAPGTVANRAFIYVDTADGDLKVKFGDGFVRVIAADS